eukprot:scaffold67825_cov57-Phaeocystis_antarctica.AAC.1
MSTELGAASAGVRRPVRMAMLVTTEHTAPRSSTHTSCASSEVAKRGTWLGLGLGLGVGLGLGLGSGSGSGSGS